MMTRLAPYVVSAVCTGAIFAWEERIRRQNCQALGQSRKMQDTITHLVQKCIGGWRAGYLATSGAMGAVLVIAPYLGAKTSMFAAEKLRARYSAFPTSKKFTIIALCGMSLASFASYAVYAPSMHWGKQAVVIAISCLAHMVFYLLYRHSLSKDENRAIGKIQPQQMIVQSLVGIGVTVVAKNYMVNFLLATHVGVLIEQMAIRRFASLPETTQPGKA